MHNFKIGDQVEFIGEERYKGAWDAQGPLYVRDFSTNEIQLTTENPYSEYNPSKSYSHSNPEDWKLIGHYLYTPRPEADVVAAEWTEALEKWRFILDVH